MKNIIFIAPPAAGKGTQSKLLSSEYNIPHISTGDILRNEVSKKTKLGQELNKVMTSGGLVSDEIITKLLKKRLMMDDTKNGYIIDGYPRNMNQAKILMELLKELNHKNPVVIFFDIDRDRALKRTLSRIVCPKCGASYNLLNEDLKPKKENICDLCGSSLEIRKDDTEDVFLKRFDTYISSTKDLIKYYEDLGLLYVIKVLDKPAEEIFMEVKKAIND